MATDVIVTGLGQQGPPGASGGTFGGDLAVRTSTSQTVVGLQNLALAAPSVSYTALSYVAGALTWLAAGATTLAGDVIGTVSGQTIATTLAAIDGKTLPSPSGTGTVLTYSGSTLSWAPAGATSLSGDVTGSVSAGVVATTLVAIDGNSLPAPSGTNTYLKWSGTALSWASGAGGAQSLSGDVTGTLSGTNIATTLAAIQGKSVPTLASGYLYYSGSAFSWASGGGGSGATSLTGDVTGTISGSAIATTLVAIDGHTLPTPTTGFLYYTGTSLEWAAGASGATALSGDVIGTVTASTITTTLVAIDGNTLPSPSGSGTVLYWSGTALSWHAAASAPSIQLTGDCVGNSTSPIATTVEGLWNNAIPNTSGAGAGTFLQWTGSAFAWANAGGGGGGGITSLYNDVTTPLSSSGATQATAVALTGASGVATIRCNTLSWASTTSPGVSYSGSNNFAITVSGTLSITTGSGSPYLNFSSSSVQLAMSSSSLTLSATLVSLVANGTTVLSGSSGAVQLAAGSTTVLSGGGASVQLVYTSGNYIQVQAGEITATVGGAGLLAATSTATSLAANNAYILEGTATTTTLLAANAVWAQATTTTTVLSANGSTILQGNTSQTSLAFGSVGITCESTFVAVQIGAGTTVLSLTASTVAFPQLSATAANQDSTHWVPVTVLLSGVLTSMKLLLHS